MNGQNNYGWDESFNPAMGNYYCHINSYGIDETWGCNPKLYSLGNMEGIIGGMINKLLALLKVQKEKSAENEANHIYDNDENITICRKADIIQDNGYGNIPELIGNISSHYIKCQTEDMNTWEQSYIYCTKEKSKAETDLEYLEKCRGLFVLAKDNIYFAKYNANIQKINDFLDKDILRYTEMIKYFNDGIDYIVKTCREIAS